MCWIKTGSWYLLVSQQGWCWPPWRTRTPGKTNLQTGWCYNSVWRNSLDSFLSRQKTHTSDRKQMKLHIYGKFWMALTHREIQTDIFVTRHTCDVLLWQRSMRRGRRGNGQGKEGLMGDQRCRADVQIPPEGTGWVQFTQGMIQHRTGFVMSLLTWRGTGMRSHTKAVSQVSHNEKNPISRESDQVLSSTKASRHISPRESLCPRNLGYQFSCRTGTVRDHRGKRHPKCKYTEVDDTPFDPCTKVYAFSLFFIYKAQELNSMTIHVRLIVIFFFCSISWSKNASRKEHGKDGLSTVNKQC